MKHMDNLNTVARELAHGLQATREADRSQLMEEAAAAGGAAAWLSLLGLADSSPADVSGAELGTETRAFWEAAGRRERTCARCPESGGACAGEDSALAPGHRLGWGTSVDGRRVPGSAGCGRWEEHVLRERLAEAGVPFRALGCSVQNLDLRDEALTVARDEIGQVVQIFCAQRAPAGLPWIVLDGPHASGKTHLLVAALRTVRRVLPGVRCAYQDAAQLDVLCKAHMDSDHGVDPFDRLAAAQLLVLDNCDPTTWKPWLQQRVIDGLLRARWDAAQLTLIGTHDSPDAVAACFAALTQFSVEAVVCSLR